MKHTNRFIALICAIMVIISAVFCVSAVPVTGDSTSANVPGSGNTLPGNGVSATVTAAEYVIPVKGDKPISTEQIYNIKVMTLDATYNGVTEKLIISVYTDEKQTVPKLAITDSTGMLLSPDNLPYCKARKSNELSTGDFFKVIIKGGKLITARDGEDKTQEMLMLEGLTFANVELSNGAYDVAKGPESATAATTTQPVTQEPQTEELTTQPEKNKKEGSWGWLAVVAVAVIVAIGALVAYFVIRAKSSDTVSKPTSKKSGRKSADTYKPSRKTEPKERFSEKKSAKKVQKLTDTMDIPISKQDTEPELPPEPVFEMYNIEVKYPQPYQAEYKIDAGEVQPQEEKVEEDNNVSNTPSLVARVFAGEVPYSELKDAMVPVCVTNSYDMEIDNFIAPEFSRGTDFSSSDFVVDPERNQVYLNFVRFNGDNFRVYSNIEGIANTFNIVSDYGKAKPLGQMIVELVPAQVEYKNGKYSLVKKGVIKVKEG